MDKNSNQKILRRNETSIVNVSNQIAITNKVLKSIRDQQLSTLSTLSTFTDSRDGNVYKTLKIGNQIWMAENLRFLPHVCPSSEDGGIWVYNYNGKNTKKAISTEYYKEYGCLYDWITARSISPLGWHLPSDEEWKILVDYLGGDSIAGGKLKEKGTTHWENPNIGASNESGFKAIPCGYRHSDGTYIGGGYSCWWSSSEKSTTDAWSRSIFRHGCFVFRGSHNKEVGIYVRCIQDI